MIDGSSGGDNSDMEHGTDYANYPLYPEDFNDNIEEGYDYGDEDETAKMTLKY